MDKLGEEKKLWKKGFKRVACLDEAGRGCLGGPVVAAAVMINPKSKILNPKQFQNSNFNPSTALRIDGERNRTIKIKKCFGHLNFGHWNLFGIWNLGFGILFKEVKDSKKLSPPKREKLYKLLKNCPFIEWGIGRVSEKVIDKINVKNAAELAMVRAVRNLKIKPDFLIIDGNHIANLNLKSFNYKLIVKADEKVFSCSAASIIAKVSRDRIMLRYHKKYPKYGFDKHKGYPTKLHLRMLKRYGCCKIHRKSFESIAKL